MAFLDNIYSGKYYRYRTLTTEEIPAARTRLQHQYFYNFIISSLLTSIVFVLISIIIGKLMDIRHSTNIIRFYKIWNTLMPSLATTLIFSFAFITLLRTRHLKYIEHVKHAIRSFPWVIGSVQGGLLLVNLDIDNMDCDPKAEAMTQLSSISNIAYGQKTLTALLQYGPFKKFQLKKRINSDTEALYILAVCEILNEQNRIGNSAFFTSPKPLDLYIKINHQKEDLK